VPISRGTASGGILEWNRGCEELYGDDQAEGVWEDRFVEAVPN
jgi:hypothetical protein